MAGRRRANPFFDKLKGKRHSFDVGDIVKLFEKVDRNRVEKIAEALAKYISSNLPESFEKRNGLADYRTNPYVLMTSATVMNLSDPRHFADFLFNSKLYMALETSFGKSVESLLLGNYPISSSEKWSDPPEKIEEAKALEGLTREEKAKKRTSSVWREIDKSCVVGNRRYLVSVKSGPNTINDTQVQAMTQAIIDHHMTWLRQTRKSNPEVSQLDIVIGLTYGTDRTTNNKENQILAKLLEFGFKTSDLGFHPCVISQKDRSSICSYRCIGRDFWSFIGDPADPSSAQFVFLEVLLALAKALSVGIKNADLESRINMKMKVLADALAKLQFPRKGLPVWIREDFNEDELFWFATALTAFFDEGI